MVGIPLHPFHKLHATRLKIPNRVNAARLEIPGSPSADGPATHRIPSMKSSKRVGIGVIGAGFIADTRARCYGMVAGYDAELVAVAARSEASAQAYAARHAVPKWSTDFQDVLANPEVDMVDL